MSEIAVQSPHQPRRRGRPLEVDPESIARVALSLFLERGFDETSLDDVAEAAQVSRRTLFRYFTSKRELVWGGSAEAIERMREALANAPETEPALDALRRAHVASVTFPAEVVEPTRQRLRLIAANAELRAWGATRTEGALELLAEFLARRTGREPDDLGPRVAAHAMSAAASAAIFWWAEHGQGDPAAVVDDVLRRLGPGLGTAANHIGQ